MRKEGVFGVGLSNIRKNYLQIKENTQIGINISLNGFRETFSFSVSTDK